MSVKIIVKVGINKNKRFFLVNFTFVFEKIILNEKKATGLSATPKTDNFSNEKGLIVVFCNEICNTEPKIHIKINVKKLRKAFFS